MKADVLNPPQTHENGPGRMPVPMRLAEMTFAPLIGWSLRIAVFVSSYDRQTTAVTKKIVRRLEKNCSGGKFCSTISHFYQQDSHRKKGIKKKMEKTVYGQFHPPSSMIQVKMLLKIGCYEYLFWQKVFQIQRFFITSFYF